MKLTYNVHSISCDAAEITAQVAGVDRQATIEVATVELTAPGTAVTFRFDDVEAAHKLFQIGKPVDLSFAKGK